MENKMKSVCYHMYHSLRGVGKFTALVLVLILVLTTTFTNPPKAYAATSPGLGTADSFSVLGHETITNTDTSTTISGDLGVYAGSAYTGFPPGVVGPPGTIHAGDTVAQDAQAGNTAAFTTLDQGCDTTYTGTQDLVGLNLVPGVYCADAFALSGTLTLSGSGVWIFKSAADLITSGTANVVGGDPCNVWWREVSSATLGTNTSLIGNILASTSISLQTGASLNGRALAQTGAVTMDNNTIFGPVCAATPTPTPTPTLTSPTPTSVASSTSSSADSSSSSSGGSSSAVCPTFNCVTPIIIESRRVDADSIFISWGPYSGIDTFIVQYGPENGKWLYNTKVTGFSTTINALPLNQPIWVLIAPTDDCSIGPCGVAKLVGGQTEAVNPNVLGVSFPNTGFAPHQNNISWENPAGIFAGILILLALIQGKYWFSSKHESLR